MSSFTALRTLAAQRFTDPSNAIVGDLPASNIRNWSDYINSAYREVNRKTPLWPWLESAELTLTVTANTRGAALPTNVYQVNWVYDTTNDKRIIPDIGRGSQYRGGYQLRSTTAQVPETYKIRAGNIELYPKPTVDVIVAYEAVVYPAALVNNGDLPVFPDVFHDILVDGALALAYADDGNFQEYNLLWQKFTTAVEGMKNAMLAFRSETYAPVRDAFWG